MVSSSSVLQSHRCFIKRFMLDPRVNETFTSFFLAFNTETEVVFGLGKPIETASIYQIIRQRATGELW